MIIVQDVPSLVDRLRGWRLGTVAMVSLFTGLRLSETLALHWNCVDFDRGVLKVREALEQTKAQGIRFKPPKSKAGRRDITLPDMLVEVLRDHRKEALELRMRLGVGRLADDELLFATIEGSPLSPNAVSAAWADFAASIGLPHVTFHALRHTHASQLIHEGVDIVTISKRLGHVKPERAHVRKGRPRSRSGNKCRLEWSGWQLGGSGRICSRTVPLVIGLRH
jgi:integrase